MNAENLNLGGYDGPIETAYSPLVRRRHIRIPRSGISEGLADEPPLTDETAVKPAQQLTEEIPRGNLS